MKYACVINGIVAEVVRVDPFTLFREGYAMLFIECPPDTEPGWTFDGNAWAPAE